MSKTSIEVVQELLADITNPEVVNRLVSSDAVYISLTFDNPELKKVMRWAGTHSDGRAAIIKTFEDVRTFWTIDTFDVKDIFGDEKNVAVFGSFTVHSVKLDKSFLSPFAIQFKLVDGLITFMQYMEDTFGTGSSFRSGGTWTFEVDPNGETVEVG